MSENNITFAITLPCDARPDALRDAVYFNASAYLSRGEPDIATILLRLGGMVDVACLHLGPRYQAQSSAPSDGG